jgi:uncharacterized membrane protein
MSMSTPQGQDVVPQSDEPDPRAVASERLTFFADAVIAIAITLLALDLKAPGGSSNKELLASVSANRGSYIAFLISFAVIARHWAGHHRMFRYVTRLGGRIPLLSMLWLLMLVVTPFTTQVLGDDGGFQFRFIVYASVQALAGIFFLLMVREIKAYRLYRPNTPPGLFADAYFGAGGLALGFLVSIPVSFRTEYAYDCWIAFPILAAGAHALWNRRHKPGTAHGQAV